MDTDSNILFPQIVAVCVRSKYSLDELEAIFWNEVRPAVGFNLWLLPAPEWAGFETTWLASRVLKKHRYGHRLPLEFLHPYSNRWWRKLRAAIDAKRMHSATRSAKGGSE
jgi:hypothetical protein